MQVTNDIDQVEIVQLLLQLDDLKDLGNVALLELANTARIENLKKGAFARLRLSLLDPVEIIHEARDEIHEIVALLLH